MTIAFFEGIENLRQQYLRYRQALLGRVRWRKTARASHAFLSPHSVAVGGLSQTLNRTRRNVWWSSVPLFGKQSQIWKQIRDHHRLTVRRTLTIEMASRSLTGSIFEIASTAVGSAWAIPARHWPTWGPLKRALTRLRELAESLQLDDIVVAFWRNEIVICTPASPERSTTDGNRRYDRHTSFKTPQKMYKPGLETMDRYSQEMISKPTLAILTVGPTLEATTGTMECVTGTLSTMLAT